jgi:hypothetical protein
MCRKGEECGGREMDESERGMRQKKKEVRWKEEE